ncbi:hypothetical protein QBC35DRAFT_186341 [Podospora australis]|uniref:Zn(2)-C6 fungal-type domain-containing protein n=1 Tax=Podospora australis TaxID=1536484 RepID=A0AAN7AJT6_9PEZI|nr:hypothetical protein QBC35DRAFT_186341 [Podospora australis]
MASRIAPISESATVLPEARSHSPWRRSACDRCRSQKLRCTRKKEDDTSTPCTRCLRIRFPCFTSPAKPPGRLAHRRAAAQEASLCGVDSRRQGPMLTLPASGHGISMGDQLACGNSVYAPWPYIQGHDRPFALDETTMALSWPEETHSINPFDFSVQNSSLLIDAHNPYGNPHVHTSTQHHPSLLAISSPPNYHQVQPFGLDKVQPITLESESPPLFSSSGSDAGVSLAILQQSLSKQLHMVKSLPRDFSILNIPIRTSSEGHGNLNPLASVLSSTSEFLELSQMFRGSDEGGSPRGGHRKSPSITDDGSPQASRWPSPASSVSHHSQVPTQFSTSAGSSSVSSPSSSAVVDPALGGIQLPVQRVSTQQLSGANLLTLVSCYLQLLSIYDAIFEHVLIEVATAIHTGSNMQHALAHALPIGFSRGYGHTDAEQRAALLAQMVERQLETVERALGLPVDYCVSTIRRGGAVYGQGLLSGREASGVLGLLLGPGAQYGEELMMDGFVASTVEQVNVVMSLREKIHGLSGNGRADIC